MTQEIEIHRSLNHKNVVGFERYFEDDDNVYVILELCRRRVRLSLASCWLCRLSVSHRPANISSRSWSCTRDGAA